MTIVMCVGKGLLSPTVHILMLRVGHGEVGRLVAAELRVNVSVALSQECPSQISEYLPVTIRRENFENKLDLYSTKGEGLV